MNIRLAQQLYFQCYPSDALSFVFDLILLKKGSPTLLLELFATPQKILLDFKAIRAHCTYKELYNGFLVIDKINLISLLNGRMNPTRHPNWLEADMCLLDFGIFISCATFKRVYSFGKTYTIYIKYIKFI